MDNSQIGFPAEVKKDGKRKAFLRYTLCVVAGLVLAAVIIFVASSVQGASSPEKAVAGYLEASMLYDTDGMLDYASEYQKASLNDGRLVDDSVLKSTLDKFYADKPSMYLDSEITFSLVSVVKYDKDSDKFNSVYTKYAQKADADSIDEVAVVTMKTVVDGNSEGTQTYVAVKCGPRWYYGYAGK